MNVDTTPLPGVLVVSPRVFADDRGFFLETFHLEKYGAHGIKGPFVQDNWSRSSKNIVRGLHFQHPQAQGKLVCVTRGAVWDVAVDIRVGSPTFGKWFGLELSESNRKQLWIPPGFAHGFASLGETNDFLYKCTALYSKEHEQAARWDDPSLKIEWPVVKPIISPRDAAAPLLSTIATLPRFEG